MKLSTIFTESKKRIFVDTCIWVALIDVRDQYHEGTVDWLNKNVKLLRLHTSSYVVAETLTFLNAKLGWYSARAFYEKIENQKKTKHLTLHPFSQRDFADIFNVMHKYSDHTPSFVDASNIYLIKKHKLDAIFSFDKVFGKTGVKMVP